MTVLKLDRDDGRAFPLWRLWWVLRLMHLRAAWIRYDRTRRGWHPGGVQGNRGAVPRRQRVHWIRYDRTKRGWHVVICLAGKLSPVEVVALQAVMGSDRNREAFNLARARLIESGAAPRSWRYNVLFERKL